MTDETMELIMSALNALEKAVLEQMRQKADGLAEQINQATVERRNNTGVGFYTKLRIEKRERPVESGVLGGVYAHVKGLNHPMTFVLFMKDGVIDTLEGAAVETAILRGSPKTARTSR
jgi:hypothetical protein